VIAVSRVISWNLKLGEKKKGKGCKLARSPNLNPPNRKDDTESGRGEGVIFQWGEVLYPFYGEAGV